jgi:ABC-2 type transport system permease protein
MPNAVVTDRESFGMLKFIRISPVAFHSYLLGRGLAKAAQAAIGASTTLLIGMLIFPELRQALIDAPQRWPWLAVYLLLGVPMSVAIGLILASAVLNMARHGMYLSESVAGVLYLLCGAVFPIEILPNWLRPISLVLPPTYWMEGMRRALLGPGRGATLGDIGDTQILLALLLSTLMLIAVSLVFFHWSERRAWRLGYFDEISTT